MKKIRKVFCSLLIISLALGNIQIGKVEAKSKVKLSKSYITLIQKVVILSICFMLSQNETMFWIMYVL